MYHQRRHTTTPACRPPGPRRAPANLGHATAAHLPGHFTVLQDSRVQLRHRQPRHVVLCRNGLLLAARHLNSHAACHDRTLIPVQPLPELLRPRPHSQALYRPCFAHLVRDAPGHLGHHLLHLRLRGL